jgi:hypothetical protein
MPATGGSGVAPFFKRDFPANPIVFICKQIDFIKFSRSTTTVPKVYEVQNYQAHRQP